MSLVHRVHMCRLATTPHSDDVTKDDWIEVCPWGWANGMKAGGTLIEIVNNWLDSGPGMAMRRTTASTDATSNTNSMRPVPRLRVVGVCGADHALKSGLYSSRQLTVAISRGEEDTQSLEKALEAENKKYGDSRNKTNPGVILVKDHEVQNISSTLIRAQMATRSMVGVRTVCSARDWLHADVAAHLIAQKQKIRRPTNGTNGEN